jgi:DNA-binding HxlR family transcriptional regulator
VNLADHQRAFARARRFGDLLDHLDGISPTLLTVRLTALIESSVVQKTALPRPVNAQLYELTDVGREIQPAIRELIRWGGPFLETHSNRIGCCLVWMPSPGAHQYPGKDWTYRNAWNKSAAFTVTGGRNGTTIEKGGADGKTTLEAPFDAVLQIVGTTVSLEEAIAAKRAKVLAPPVSFASFRNFSILRRAGVGRQQSR